MASTMFSVMLLMVAISITHGQMIGSGRRCDPNWKEQCGHGMVCEQYRCEPVPLCVTESRRILADIKAGRLQDADPGSIQCSNDGNYKPRQCTRSPFFSHTSCSCVDKYTGRALKGYRSVQFDSRADPSKNMTCDCAQRQAVYLRQGDYFQECEPQTGNYPPVRCGDKVCACVDYSGHPVKENGREIYESFKTGESTCSCARDLYEYQLLNILGRQFNCDEHGRYDPVQCRGTLCFCADERGRQRQDGPTAPIHLIHTLRC